MSKPIIAIDIDDTLANSTELIRLKVNDKYSVSIPADAYRSKGEYWGYYERVWAEHGLTNLKSADFHREIVDEFLKVPLLPSAEFAVHELAKRFHIVIITARHPEWGAITKKWVTDNFQGLEIDVHFSEAHRDESKMTKGQICHKIGAKYLIDDNVVHCQSAIDQNITAILYGEYGWHNQVPEQMVRCRDWPAILDYFSSV